MTRADGSGGALTGLVGGFEQRVFTALRHVLATYAHNLAGHELTADDLWLLFQCQGRSLPRSELLRDAALTGDDGDERIDRLLAEGYLAQQGDALSPTQRTGELMRQIFEMAQRANVRWRADAAAVASDEAQLTSLLAVLQSSRPK